MSVDVTVTVTNKEGKNFIYEIVTEQRVRGSFPSCFDCLRPHNLIHCGRFVQPEGLYATLSHSSRMYEYEVGTGVSKVTFFPFFRIGGTSTVVQKRYRSLFADEELTNRFLAIINTLGFGNFVEGKPTTYKEIFENGVSVSGQLSGQALYGILTVYRYLQYGTFVKFLVDGCEGYKSIEDLSRRFLIYSLMANTYVQASNDPYSISNMYQIECGFKYLTPEMISEYSGGHVRQSLVPGSRVYEMIYPFPTSTGCNYLTSNTILHGDVELFEEVLYETIDQLTKDFSPVHDVLDEIRNTKRPSFFEMPTYDGVYTLFTGQSVGAFLFSRLNSKMVKAISDKLKQRKVA